MKNVFLLGFAVIGFGAFPAIAADLPVNARPMVPVAVAAYNWSGCYIGANVGGKWARTTDDVTIAATAGTAAVASRFPADTDSTLIGGGQIGCNWQASENWVFGLEGDADAQRWTTNRTQPVTLLPLVGGPGADTFDIRSDWQASARGRVGYAWDRWMLYATGGAAFTNVKVGANFPAYRGSRHRIPSDHRLRQ